MSQSDTDKARVADRRSEETRSFVRQVRAATRRKYTPEEKIRIVLEGFRREVTVNDLCRREGIKPHSYYAWTGSPGACQPEPYFPIIGYSPRPCPTRSSGAW